MSDTRTDEKALVDLMWRISNLMRGSYTPDRYAEMAPFCAYAALLAQDAAEGMPIKAVLTEARMDSDVRDYLLSSWDEKLDEPTQVLARQVDSAVLCDFILHYDFSTGGGKFSGEHGTPSCISKLALAILDVDPSDRVADFGCGYGDFFVELAEQHPTACLYGIDLNPAAVCLSRIRMGLLGNGALIERGDMLTGEVEGRFDKIFSNYPLGMRVASMGRGGKYYDAYRTGKTGLGRPSSADWVFNKAICDSLVPGGTAVAIMTNGAAFNGSDKQARKYFLDNGMIKAVVALPANLFRYTAVPTTLIILGKNEGPVRLVDASDLSVPGRRWDTMGDDEIATVLKRLANDDDYSRLVNKEELAATEYNLFPSRYLGRSIELENPTPLGSLALSIERGSSLTAKDLDALTVDEDTGLSYLRLSDIADGRIGHDLPHLRELDPKTERQWLRTGDLIVSKNGAPFKIAVADVPESQTIMANGNLYIIRLDTDKVNPHFVAAFLASDDGKELMDRMVVGTTIPNLPLRNLKDIELPVPTMDKQTEVARRYQAHLDEIEVLKIKLDKARAGIASAYDDVVGR
ncbi:MAG: N-6 DNA methylase [Eggerthellaceae bacterium]